LARTPRGIAFAPGLRRSLGVRGCISIVAVAGFSLALAARYVAAPRGVRGAPYAGVDGAGVGLNSGDSEPKFRLITEGACANAGMVAITKVATCEVAAAVLGLVKLEAGTTADVERPEGCYYGNERVLWMGINPLSKGKGAETSVPGASRHPVCMSRAELASARSAPSYRKIAAGSCGNVSMQPINDVATCEKAASSLGLADTSVGQTNDVKRPEGCYYGNNEVLWMGINPHSKGNGAETSGATTRDPICVRREDQEDQDPAPPAETQEDQDPAPPADTEDGDGHEGNTSPCTIRKDRAGAEESSASYHKIECGTCSKQGLEPIFDRASCEDARRTFGLGGSVQETNEEHRPEGCFIDPDNSFWLGSRRGNGVVALSNGRSFHPVCRTAGTTTPQTTSAPPLEDLDADVRFRLETEGTCASRGMFPILADSLCEAAAYALGLAQTSASRTSLRHVPEGCYYVTPPPSQGSRLFLALKPANKGLGAETSTESMARQPLCVSRGELMAHAVAQEHERKPLKGGVAAEVTLQDQLHNYAAWQGHGSCHDAAEGESCYRKVRSAMRAVLDVLPNARVDEVQATLHRRGHADCPEPCGNKTGAPLFQAAAESLADQVTRRAGDAAGAQQNETVPQKLV